MKLSARDAAAYFARPDPNTPACLIYGADAMRVALKRTDLVAALTGPDAEAEMRITRVEASDVRADPAQLSDAAKAQGFFPGPRAVVLEDAGEAHLGAVTTALADWQSGDAVLVITAGALKKTSKLRKAFEDHPTAKVAAIYDNPPSRAEVEEALSKAGLGNVDREAMNDLLSLAQSIDPGDLRQLAERLSLYKLGDDTPLTTAELESLAPQTLDAAIDDVIHAVAEGRTDQIGPLMQRLAGQGTQAVALCIAAGRHFRTLHAAASDPKGASAGIARARPPIFGPRRDKMERQARNWGARKLEDALATLVDTDLALRSAAQTAPQLALVERAFIRLAMLGRRATG